MASIRVCIEAGKKKTFAVAIDWPGWCRSGRDEGAALQAVVDYGPRYARALRGSGLEFRAPDDVAELTVIERQEGNATTDFGSPALIFAADCEPLDGAECARSQALLEACWRAFDAAVARAGGRALRKGPRGGGRDLEPIVDHVLEVDGNYLVRLAWKHKREGLEPAQELARTRQVIGRALQVAAEGNLPERGPRGGIIWPPRYFVRRVAWHVLDHAWEIEDRVL